MKPEPDRSSVVDISYLRASMALMHWPGLGETILTDPWYGRHLRGLPCRYMPLPIEELPPISMILASHLHPDHFDVEAVARIARNETVIIGPPGTAKRVRGRSSAEVVELKWWDEYDNGRVRVVATESHHSGYELNFVVAGDGVSVFFGGDSRWSKAFAHIAACGIEVDVALLPMGGTRVLGRTIVMGPEDALRAATVLGASYLVPIHEGGIWWSVPPLSRHPGRPGRLRALAGAQEAGPHVVVIPPGRTVSFSLGRAPRADRFASSSGSSPEPNHT